VRNGAEPGRLVDRLGRGIVVILAAAALTSWLQVASVFLSREVLGQFSWKWWLRDQVLLSGVGYLLLFALLGLAPLVLHLGWPRRYSLAALAATMAGLGTFCVLLLFQRVAWPAWLVVAIGAGIRLGAAAAAHPERTWRWSQRLAIGGHLATAVLALGIVQARRSAEASLLGELPAAPAGAPNVLLLVMDTERAGSMSLYGTPEPTTPYQDALAQRGVVFEAAHSTAPWTLPSHASMFTGHYASATGADWSSPMRSDLPTLAEAFLAHGYATGGFVANQSFTGYRSGLARGFVRYRTVPWSVRQALLGTTPMQSRSAVAALLMWDRTRWVRGTLEALWPVDFQQPGANLRAAPKTGAEVTEEFLAWLPTTGGRPFFAFLNLFDAHRPYLPPAGYQRMFDPEASAHGRYLGAIRYLDDQVRLLLQELERRGALATTIVVITSDHGELFGEHDLYTHGNDLYRPLLHVPLLVVNAPGAVPGTRVTQSVSLRDLGATLLDLAQVPNAARLPGTSLRPLLAGAGHLPTASPVIAELSGHDLDTDQGSQVPLDLKSLVEDTSHVIVDAAGGLRVFSYPADTAELHDRSGTPEVRTSAVQRLRRALAGQGISWPEGGA